MSRTTATSLVLFLHVLGAIVAVGPSATYGIWIGRTERLEPASTPHVLRTVRWIDRRLVTPAYGMQALTGVLLIGLEGIDVWHTGWLVAGVVIYVVVMILAVAFVGPLSRARLALAERGGPNGPEDVRRAYEATGLRLRRILAPVAIATLAIVYLMVVKPSL